MDGIDIVGVLFATINLTMIVATLSDQKLKKSASPYIAITSLIQVVLCSIKGFWVIAIMQAIVALGYGFIAIMPVLQSAVEAQEEVLETKECANCGAPNDVPVGALNHRCGYCGYDALHSGVKM